MAVYNIKADDVQATISELMRRANTEAMPLSDTLEPDVRMVLFESITPS